MIALAQKILNQHTFKNGACDARAMEFDGHRSMVGRAEKTLRLHLIHGSMALLELISQFSGMMHRPQAAVCWYNLLHS